MGGARARARPSVAGAVLVHGGRLPGRVRDVGHAQPATRAVRRADRAIPARAGSHHPPRESPRRRALDDGGSAVEARHRPARRRRGPPGQGREQRGLPRGVQRRPRGPRGTGQPHRVRPRRPHPDVAHAVHLPRRPALAQAPHGGRAELVMSEQPFAGVTILELGQFVAVPWAGQVLADGGARVIKIEPPEGEPSRHIAPLAPGESRHFVIRNRGKHALPLDLKHPDAAEILTALLARADVVLINMRPGLAAELGVEYEQLAPRYPRLIVGTVTAFGPRGPDAALAGMDMVVQARSGLMVTGGKMKDDLPTTGESPIADYMAAALLAFGVASALYRRERTGRGGRVDTSLLQSALALQNNLMIRVENVDGPRHADFRKWLAEARSTGVSFVEQVERMPRNRPVAMVAIYYRTYATRDAALSVACGSPSLRRKFIAAVGHEDAALAGARGGAIPRQRRPPRPCPGALRRRGAAGSPRSRPWRGALPPSSRLG